MHSDFPAPDARELVRFMADEKGIAFNRMSPKDAELFLQERNFFFKVKAFAKNYRKYSRGENKGKYIGLDFGCLAELTRMDKSLRSLVLQLTLDIEHCLRVRIDRSAMRHGVDRYALSAAYQERVFGQVVDDQVKRFSGEDAKRAFTRIRDMAGIDCTDARGCVVLANKMTAELAAITHGQSPTYIEDGVTCMSSSPYSRDLVRKYEGGPFPYWFLLELMTFGNVVRFYKACFGKDGLIPQEEDEASVLRRINPYLQCAKVLRNAAAHSDCLLNGLADHKQRIRASKKIKAALVDELTLDESLVNPVISVQVAMDLAAVLLCYKEIVPDGESKNLAIESMVATADRLCLHAEWFSSNNDIRDFLTYANGLLRAFAEKMRDFHPH